MTNQSNVLYASYDRAATRRRGKGRAGVILTGLAAILAVTLDSLLHDNAVQAANDNGDKIGTDPEPTGSLPTSPFQVADEGNKNTPLPAFEGVTAGEAKEAEAEISRLFASLDAANDGFLSEEAPETEAAKQGAGLGTIPVETLGVSHPGQQIGQPSELQMLFGDAPTFSVETQEAQSNHHRCNPSGEDAGQELPMYLQGTSGADVLEAGILDDALFGLGGDDLLVGGAGADLIDGGDGVDTVDYSGSGEAVNVNLDTGANFGGDAEGDTLIDIEAITGSAFDDTITGKNGQTNLLDGGAGNDKLVGGDAKDFLTGGVGADHIDGGAGSEDVAKYVDSQVGVHVSLLDGKGYTGDAAGDTLLNIEFLHGSLHDDWLIGDNRTNRIEGRHGDDHLEGMGGNDRLLGGSGADILDGGDGEDIADYDWSDYGVIVDLSTGLGSGGEAEGDVLISIEHLAGSLKDDILTGDALDNRLWGRDGDDVLVGGQGNDRLDGGAGADALFGGEGIDIADYSGAEEGVALDLATNGISGDAEGDTYHSIENVYGSNHDDQIAGDSGHNRLAGNGGNDVLFGAAGNDYLLGGTGNDTLIGGQGADVFLFEGEFGNDTITDFWAGDGRTDRIWLRDQGIETWEDLQDAMSQNGADVMIEIENGTITLQNIDLGDLVQDDFIL